MYKQFFKRLFDFLISLIALLLLGWLLIIIAMWLHFDNKGAGTLTFTDLVGCDWGVVAADGTYTLKDDVLTASYTDVTVWDSNYEKSTYHGFTSGKSKTVKYTIVSCDSKKLVMKNENGKSQTYTKYAELKK